MSRLTTFSRAVFAAQGQRARAPALAALALFLIIAAVPPAAAAEGFFDGSEDAYSTMILQQIFGPLFSSADGGPAPATLFSTVIGAFNLLLLMAGGGLFFYNITVGVLQSAHEGEVLGRRWSSLWAPLRVIFAVGLLIPVPTYGGYNLGQVGVAWLTRGGTAAASAIWSEVASLVIADDVPLASSSPRFPPEVLRTLYYNSACMRLVQYQLDAADAGATVGYHNTETLTAAPVDSGRVTAITAVTRPEHEPALVNICGGWQTPQIPEYLTDLGEAGGEVIESFKIGHARIIDHVAASMSELTVQHFEAAFDGESLPDISGEIASISTAANDELAALIASLRSAAITASGGDDARDLLLTRITGDGGGYGEGWLGAGSWYILLARLNNQLSSIVEAVPTATAAGLNFSAEQIFRAGGGEASGRRFLGFIGARSVTADDLAGAPNVEEARRILELYDEAFIASAAKLAALGFNLTSAQAAEINSDAAGGSIWDYWPAGQAALTSFQRLMLDAFNAGSFGSDPMASLITVGKGLIVLSGALALVGAVTGLATGGAVAISLLPLSAALIGAGMVFGVILPIMPFFFWILAATGYFLTVIEAVFAVSLWALGHMRLDGEGISGAAGQRGWLLLLSLALTPVLMIFGFLAGMIIFRISHELFSAGFFYAVQGVIGGSLAFGMIATIGYVILAAGFYIVLLERSFSLITEFPARVFRWLGEQDSVVSQTFAAAVVRPTPRSPAGALPRPGPRPPGGGRPGRPGLPAPEKKSGGGGGGDVIE